jgi:hypothetical protein
MLTGAGALVFENALRSPATALSGVTDNPVWQDCRRDCLHHDEQLKETKQWQHELDRQYGKAH